jgi:poly(A) polymerase
MEVTIKPHLHRDWIDSHALGIVKALQKGGFTTYLVGGCVRDLLLGMDPKDYDIATMAHPQQVKRMIYMSFIIGKRFRLVLVKRDDQQFEVATFRREIRAEDFPEGIPAGDNVFGAPEEDARRRDFTINGLFYDPVSEQLIDYVDGLRDIDARVMRMIGDPDTRLIEDPVRILRCLRLAHKIGFSIEPSLRESMKRNAGELLKAVLPRKREEILKVLRLDDPAAALLECYDLDILKNVIPTLHNFFLDDRRRELFLEHFEAYRGIVKNANDPNQLFAWLVYSVLQASIVWRHEKNLNSDHDSPESEHAQRETNRLRIEDDIFQNLMQEELGMYRLEQTTLTKAIALLSSLVRIEEFRRRGERRQHSLIRTEGFGLSLQIAAVDYMISGEEFLFWQNILENAEAEGEIEEGSGASREKRRRRPRRRRSTGEVEGADRLHGSSKAKEEIESNSKDLSKQN